MSFNRFEVISTLYNTLQDSLKLVRRKEDGKLYTIKSVKIDENSEKEKELFFNELRILVPLTHKNIIWYKEAFYDKETRTLNMVIEYVDGGDLSMKIKIAKQKKAYLKENIIWNIFIQILEGIDYLHKKFIIHRDLKTSNIYLTKKRVVKIGGLNVGKNIEGIGMALTQIGTPYFTAPEIWEQKPYDYKCDIWSIGCILYEMTSLHVPFLGLNMQELYYNILNLKYKPIPKIYSKELNEIINLILNKDPKKRPSTTELLNNTIIVNKIKELNIKNEIKDESSYLNKAVNKIINDYNNKVKKLDNTHIIYKKTEKNENNNHNLKEKKNNKALIHINTNSNNIKIDNYINIGTNSDYNKVINLNKLKNKNLNYDNMSNYNYKDKNITEYNTRRNDNYCRSDINQKINYIISNNSAGKIIDKMKKIEFIFTDNNLRNYPKKNTIKKSDINNLKCQNANNYLNLKNNEIRINSSKEIDENKYKKYMLNKILENKKNVRNEIVLKKNYNKMKTSINEKYNNNSFNNENNSKFRINHNYYKQKIADNLENNLKKNNVENIKNNQDKNNLYKKLIKRKNNNYIITNKIRNNFNSYNKNNNNNTNNSNNNNINLVEKYDNDKYDNNHNSYKLINFSNYNDNNDNNINNYNNSTKENSKPPIPGDIIKLNISSKFRKNKSNNNNYINKDFNDVFNEVPKKKMNKIEMANYLNLMNNYNKNNSNIKPKKIDFKTSNNNFRIYNSPMVGRNINSFTIKNKNLDLESYNNSKNFIPNNSYKKNICISEKQL